MKPISSKMLCERLKINRSTLSAWLDAGCPAPALSVYIGPKSDPNKKPFSIRMWSGPDITKLKRWAGSRLFARGAAQFRRGRRLDKTLERVVRDVIAAEAIRLVQLDDPNIDATTIRTAMKQNPDFERICANYHRSIRAKLQARSDVQFVN